MCGHDGLMVNAGPGERVLFRPDSRGRTAQRWFRGVWTLTFNQELIVLGKT